jgi:hypothetical protein
MEKRDKTGLSMVDVMRQQMKLASTLALSEKEENQNT